MPAYPANKNMHEGLRVHGSLTRYLIRCLPLQLRSRHLSNYEAQKQSHLPLLKKKDTSRIANSVNTAWMLSLLLSLFACSPLIGGIVSLQNSYWFSKNSSSSSLCSQVILEFEIYANKELAKQWEEIAELSLTRNENIVSNPSSMDWKLLYQTAPA